MLGGAFNGGFTSLTELGLGSLVSLTWAGKRNTRRVLRRQHCVISFVFKKLSFILSVVLVFNLFALPTLNSLKNKTAGQHFRQTPWNATTSWIDMYTSVASWCLLNRVATGCKLDLRMALSGAIGLTN